MTEKFFSELNEGDFHVPLNFFLIGNVRKGRILISYQNARSTIKVTSKELFSIQTGWIRFERPYVPDLHLITNSFMTHLSVSNNFEDRTIFSQQYENHYQYEKNVVASLSYLEATRSRRIISDSAKDSLRKEHTIIILQQGASHQHDSSIIPITLIFVFSVT